MTGLLHDLRYAIRQLGKSPGFTAVAVITLALGIGANTAIFSVVNAVLFRILPYRDPERLVEIFQKYAPNAAEDRMSVAPATYRDWQTQSGAFEQMAAFREANLNITVDNSPERVRSTQLSSSAFSTLGVAPLLGRDFQSTDERNGSAPVAILSYSLWQRRFGGSARVVGKVIKANAHLCTIIGVMPPAFGFPIGWNGSTPVEIWTPLSLTENEMQNRNAMVLEVIGRLRPGIMLGQAQADMNVVSRRLAQQYPETNKDWGVNLMPLPDRGVVDFKPLFLLLSLVVAFVLLIACANVANMLLAQGIGRQRELTIRMAVGASKRRLVRQLLTQGVVLAGVAFLFALVVAYFAIQIIVAMAPAVDIPELQSLTLSGRALAFSAGLSILTGLVFSVFPAFAFSAASLRDGLQEGGRNSGSVRHNRVKAALVIAEVSLTLALLVCAVTVIRNFVSSMILDPGFTSANLLVMGTTLPAEKYRQPEQWALFYTQLEQKIRSIPGVVAAAVSNSAPMEGNGDVLFFEVSRSLKESSKKPGLLEYVKAGDDYFRAAGMTLKRGRFFSPNDRRGAPAVALINEELAREEFSGKDPIGQFVTLGRDINSDMQDDGKRRSVQVIGVVNDTREYQYWPTMMYVPFAQDPSRSVSLIVKSAVPPATLLPEIRRRLAKLDLDQPVFGVRTEADIVREENALFRFNCWLFGAFAAIASVLALTGIYGLVAYSVASRTQEFGVRLALGATPSKILGQVLRQATLLAVIGSALGLVIAFPAARLLTQSLSFMHLRPSGPMLQAAITGAVVLIAVLAALLPARRAAKVEPMEALRYE